MSHLANASATSMNFIGFEELKGQGAPELLYNQIFIEPNLPQGTSSGNIAAAGYVPGQQSYLKRRRTIWSNRAAFWDSWVISRAFPNSTTLR